MKSSTGIADLRAGDERRTFTKSRRRRRAAGALRDVFVDLAFFVRAGTKALHRRHDHARVELVDVLPGEAHAIERARREVFDQHVARLHQPLEDFLALGMLGVDRDRSLVAVQHREVERIGALHVAQLRARDVADAGTFHLDAVRAHVGQQLRARGAGLDVGEIKNAHAIEGLAHLSPGNRLLRGLRLRASCGVSCLFLRALRVLSFSHHLYIV
jgi:hypothetical protein